MQLPTGCVLKMKRSTGEPNVLQFVGNRLLGSLPFFSSSIVKSASLRLHDLGTVPACRTPFWTWSKGSFKPKSSQDLIFRCLTACNSSSMERRTWILYCQCGPPYRSCSSLGRPNGPIWKKHIKISQRNSDASVLQADWISNVAVLINFKFPSSMISSNLGPMRKWSVEPTRTFAKIKEFGDTLRSIVNHPRSTKVPLRSQSPQHGDASTECHTPWVHMADLRKLDAFQARNCLCSVLGISDYDKCTEILCEILFHTLHMLMLIAQVYELQLKHGASEWVPFG